MDSLLTNTFTPMIALQLGLSLVGIPLTFWGIVRCMRYDKGRGLDKKGLVMVIVATALLIGAMVANGVAMSAVENARASWLADRGVSEVDWEELDWPSSRPSEDTRFGMADAEVDGQQSAVRLTWEDGEFALYEVGVERILLPAD